MDLRRERIIELAARIQKMREELPGLEQELDGLLRAGNGTEGGVTATTGGNPPGTGQAVVPLITQFLASRPGQTFSAPTIAKGIGPVKMPSVRSALMRMTKDGRIDRVGRGKFRLAKMGC